MSNTYAAFGAAAYLLRNSLLLAVRKCGGLKISFKSDPGKQFLFD
jgi:hypothetical protein